jgi:hypothetical protein
MLERKWLTLPAGLLWAMTRNDSATERVQKDPEAFKGIALNIAAHLAEREIEEGKLPTYFDNAGQAWLAIRDLIADEKITADGQPVERRNFMETSYVNRPIPPGEARNLILLDGSYGFTETVLGPDELYRFHDNQGRYWKRVRLSAQLFVAFPPPSNEPPTLRSESPRGDYPKVEQAVKIAYPSGIPYGLTAADVIKAIGPHLKNLGKIPTTKTLRTHIKTIRDKPGS